MKKPLLLFLLISFSSYAQDKVEITVKKEKSFTEQQNDREQLRINRAAAMSEPSSNIKVPVTVDFNNYTHIALVGVNFWVRGWGIRNHKGAYEKLKGLLSYSFLEVINPAEEDKKKFKKNPLFLRETKDPNWLYVYYKDAFQGVDYINSLVIRDSKNKILYSATHTNFTTTEILSPLVDF